MQQDRTGFQPSYSSSAGSRRLRLRQFTEVFEPEWTRKINPDKCEVIQITSRSTSLPRKVLYHALIALYNTSTSRDRLGLNSNHQKLRQDNKQRSVSAMIHNCSGSHYKPGDTSHKWPCYTG